MQTLCKSQQHPCFDQNSLHVSVQLCFKSTSLMKLPHYSLPGAAIKYIITTTNTTIVIFRGDVDSHQPHKM